MALTFARGLILILPAASMLTESMANWGWYNGSNNTNSWAYGVRKMGSHNSNNTNDDAVF